LQNSGRKAVLWLAESRSGSSRYLFLGASAAIFEDIREQLEETVGEFQYIGA